MITKEMIVNNAEMIADILQNVIDVHCEEGISQHTKDSEQMQAFEDIINLFVIDLVPWR